MRFCDRRSAPSLSLDVMPNRTPEMMAGDVVEFLQLLDRQKIEVWVDGGWGVDALLGRQTRPHADLDIAIRHSDVPAVRRLLGERGYRPIPRPDTRDCNFVLGDEAGHEIDVHTFTFDADGKCIFGIAYPADSLTGSGMIAGHRTRCICAEWMVQFHSGYVLKLKDYRDVSALCSAFGIELPREYERFRDGSTVQA